MAYLTTQLCDSLDEESLEQLNKANVWTINDLVGEDLAEIKRRAQVKYTTLKELRLRVLQRYTVQCHELDFVLEKSIRDCKMFPTGIPELTRALDGGFQTQEIVELFGDSECGKTEICYLLTGEILSHYEDYHILFIASNHDIDHEKIAKYTRLKAGGRELSEEDMFNALKRVEIARPKKLADLVHLLNTLAHDDKRNNIKCIIVDSLSFIIQEDILEIRTANLNDADELEKFLALKGKSLLHRDSNATVDTLRREFTDNYIHEVMRLLTTTATSRNVIIVLTNSDQHLTASKFWTNAVDHRIHLRKMHELSRPCLSNPEATVRQATVVKTIHNITKVGFSFPFAINDEGLFAIRLAATEPATCPASQESPKSS